MKTALITGIAGQDGLHLTDWLAGKNYRVCGLARGPYQPTILRLGQAGGPLENVEIFPCELRDQAALARVLEKVAPDEIYNLASKSFVPASWDEPALTAEFSGIGVTRLLEAMRLVCPKARFFQASSSEMFGMARAMPQNEETPFHPRTPYGSAKVYGHHMVGNYREHHGLYATSGIFFNHEGPRRGEIFVTRKITRAVARIKLGLDKELRLGNLDARRDWGYAGDYVRAMWLMLQQDQADDFVIGTGETHSVEDFVTRAFDHVGIDWREHVVVDPRLCRPPEPVHLVADAAKARRVLGWRPETSFAELVTMMVDADLRQECRDEQENPRAYARSA